MCTPKAVRGCGSWAPCDVASILRHSGACSAGRARPSGLAVSAEMCGCGCPGRGGASWNIGWAGAAMSARVGLIICGAGAGGPVPVPIPGVLAVLAVVRSPSRSRCFAPCTVMYLCTIPHMRQPVFSTLYVAAYAALRKHFCVERMCIFVPGDGTRDAPGDGTRDAPEVSAPCAAPDALA